MDVLSKDHKSKNSKRSKKLNVKTNSKNYESGSDVHTD